MWPELRERIALERQLLRQLLEESAPLLVRCQKEPPTVVERWALAAMLHSFYNGVENIFKRIARECDGAVPGGPAAHRDLLDSMAEDRPHRPPVISDALRDTLEKYLDFRHMFRHAYTFDLRWDKMAAAVLACEDTLRRFDAEVAAFCDRLEA